ncbi:3-phenylpropionate-dihydrodiol/cinnamic acid-dihydrodiol dehydrogenase [Candidatus Magnetaquicoccaceae bacterium FCR-1]|uniref:3-phenylpropionate-dihydrodiol/cinnamic acid-dihydrodiol dehydrogenase n=1 Tax=Candidatus Magnetaquiglobus chichijimensis TaxID=3141448 RepID=A0ABQ0C9S8_9PROT
MINRWSDHDAAETLERLSSRWGEPLALRTYTSRLLGADKGLVLHGGGNTSVKARRRTLLGTEVMALFVKGSGWDLDAIEPEGFTALDWQPLRALDALPHLDDAVMVNELMIRRFDAEAPTPSIETLLHAFLPHAYIDHTHADAILALTNQPDGEARIRAALGDEVAILPYVHPGFELAKAVSILHAAHPGCKGMVLMKHGLVTWGASARESYDATIDLVSRAEAYITRIGKPVSRSLRRVTAVNVARARYLDLAPRLRGALALPTGNPDHPHARCVLVPVITRETLNLVDAENGPELAITPPLTSDHLIRTRNLPLWIDDAASIPTAIAEFQHHYRERFQRLSSVSQPPKIFDPTPRILFMPGIGAICVGRTAQEAAITRDILWQTLQVKEQIAAMGGTYQGLEDPDLFAMEYFPLQIKKLARLREKPLARHIALVTGAAGAIGAGICRGLLEQGCHVAGADLAGEALETLTTELNVWAPGRFLPVVMDVTSPEAVSAGFAALVEQWGGVDLVIPNAGLAHVAALDELQPAMFQRLQRVNVEGTLLVLAEAARIFKKQATGGDIVMISTKNVFAPGARFGAYSATKAAAHQLARIASLEMAEYGVRVNMVSPDGVFSDGARPSGLWAEVGPDRMKARGLDADGLQEYYRNRNLLKARITAAHVSEAVLFFATRRTPTTGATLPVDGGLPDATPR